MRTGCHGPWPWPCTHTSSRPVLHAHLVSPSPQCAPSHMQPLDCLAACRSHTPALLLTLVLLPALPSPRSPWGAPGWDSELVKLSSDLISPLVLPDTPAGCAAPSGCLERPWRLGFIGFRVCPPVLGGLPAVGRHQVLFILKLSTIAGAWCLLSNLDE